MSDRPRTARRLHPETRLVHDGSLRSQFAETSELTDVVPVHAYSHVNTFSSAAMVYAVHGDPRYLDI